MQTVSSCGASSVLFSSLPSPFSANFITSHLNERRSLAGQKEELLLFLMALLFNLLHPRVATGGGGGGGQLVNRKGATSPVGDSRGISQREPNEKKRFGDLLPSVVSIIHKLTNKSNLFNLI